MSDPSISILSFKPDNPCNTLLVNEEGVEIYAVHTDFTDESKPTTRVNDAHGKCIAEWVWRDVRSDLLTFKDKPQIPASAWLHKSFIPFNSDVTFEDGSGRKYKWKNISPGVYPQLFSSESKSQPIARFQRALKDPQGVNHPVLRPAQLLFDPRADEIRDMVVVSFLILERRRRESSTESESRASVMAVSLSSSLASSSV